jgi:hypothetical protein
MTTVITAHEATIRTATVEIKSLTISGKQVTLSVFRQIPYQHIIGHYTSTEMPALLGFPWGTVNYFWPGCVSGDRTKFLLSGSLHVVWQDDDALYRSVVSPFALGPFTYGQPDKRDEWQAEYKKLYEELASLPQLFIAV